MSNIIIDLLSNCNLKCEFCYQDILDSKLSKENILSNLTKYNNYDRVDLGGGEPFLHEDIIQIIKSISDLDKRIIISTNGTIIPQEFLDLEEKIKNKTNVQVSLHASNEKLYQDITGQNLFNQVMQNIEKIKPKYSTSISSVIYKKNYEDVENLISLAKEFELPIRINLVHPIGYGKNVELLNEREVDTLKGYLLTEHLQNKNLVDSPLIHNNNCISFANHYGFQKTGECPIDCALKIYINPKNEVYNCQFSK
jgi:MoaA/NifB/PqqE/SkfB family radical SAM enzyme